MSNEEINKPITVNEIQEVIMNLKINKAGSCDNILNEHIVHAADSFLPCDVLNCILEFGHFPEQWTKGVIVSTKTRVIRLRRATTDPLHCLAVSAKCSRP